MSSLIPLNNIILENKLVKKDILKAYNTLIDNSIFSTGRYIQELEEVFANYCTTKYAVAVSNGTAAIHLALRAIGIKKGDEIIVPSNTFIGTIWGILYENAIPVFIDCDETWNIDTSKIEKHLTEKTKAIIGVHLYGLPCNATQINKICKVKNIAFIEDASQAHGALYKDKKVGALGDIACFSCYPTKNLGGFGEGGLITTNNKNYYTSILNLRNHAQKQKYYHSDIGYNYRMSSVVAISLTVKLNYIDQWNANRQKHAYYYLEHIKNSKIKLPVFKSNSIHVFHQFVIQVEDRREFIAYMKSHNIETQLHYPIPCHKQEIFQQRRYKSISLPQTEHHCNTCVSIPVNPFLSKKEIHYIVSTINNF